jgi:hypothetical protein
MISVLTRVTKAWNDYRHWRLLKKLGWTQKDFDLHTDPDYNMRASRVKDIFQGYPYIHTYELPSGSPWNEFGDWLEGLTVINGWCDASCKDKWRENIHRVMQDERSDWVINELGGSDMLFFAFKNERDYLMFVLRWT